MPRVELIPAPWTVENWEQSPEAKAGEGSPTVDLCQDCADARDEGDELNDSESRKFGVGPATIAEKDCDHPPYDECDYSCAWCDDLLTGDDD